MALAIMILSTKTKLPRPFNRAGSRMEALEMLSRVTKEVNLANIDTDEPVAASRGNKYYIFTED